MLAGGGRSCNLVRSGLCWLIMVLVAVVVVMSVVCGDMTLSCPLQTVFVVTDSEKLISPARARNQ